MTRSTAPSFSDDLSWLTLPTINRLRTEAPIEYSVAWSLPRDSFTEACVRLARDFPLPIARLALYDNPSCKDSEFSRSVLMIDVLRVLQYVEKDAVKIGPSRRFPWLAHSSLWLIDENYRPYPSLSHWLSHVITDRAEADAWIARAFESIGDHAKNSVVRIIPFEEGSVSCLIPDTGMYPDTHRRVFCVENNALPSFVPKNALKIPVPKDAPVAHAIYYMFCTVNGMGGVPPPYAVGEATTSDSTTAEADVDVDTDVEEEGEEPTHTKAVDASTAHSPVTEEPRAHHPSPAPSTPSVAEAPERPAPSPSERGVRQATVRHREGTKKRARESPMSKLPSVNGVTADPLPVKRPKKRSNRCDDDDEEEDEDTKPVANPMPFIDLEETNENLRLEIDAKNDRIANLEKTLATKLQRITDLRAHLSDHVDLTKRHESLRKLAKARADRLEDAEEKLEIAVAERKQLETEKRELGERIAELERLEKMRPPPVGMIEERAYNELKKAHEEAIVGHEKRIRELLAKHESERNEYKRQTDLLEASVAEERERWSVLKADCERLIRSVPERRFDTPMTGEAHMFISALIRELTMCVGALDKDIASRDRRISELELDQQRGCASMAANVEQLETSKTLRAQDAHTIEELRSQYTSANHRILEVERELTTLREQRSVSDQMNSDVFDLLLGMGASLQRMDAMRKVVIERHFPDRDFTYRDPSVVIQMETLATGDVNAPDTEDHPNALDDGNSHGMTPSSSLLSSSPSMNSVPIGTIDPAMLRTPNVHPTTTSTTAVSFSYTEPSAEFSAVIDPLIQQAQNYEEASRILTATEAANKVMSDGPPTAIFGMSPSDAECDRYGRTPPSTPAFQPMQQPYQPVAIPPPLPVVTRPDVRSAQMPTRELIGRIDEQSREAARHKTTPDMFVDESHAIHQQNSSRKKSGGYNHGGYERRAAAVAVGHARSKSGGSGRKPKYEASTMENFKPQQEDYDAAVDDNLLASRGAYSTSRT